MRLFIAFDIPPEVCEKLTQIQDGLKKFNGGFNFSKSFHETLKFFGEVSPEKMIEIREKLRNVNFQDLRLEMNSIGGFPDMKNPKVIWAGFKDKDPVVELQRKIEEVLVGMFNPEKDFVPHVTLARVKYLNEKIEFRKMEIPDLSGVFIIKKIVLYESELTSAGTVYKAIEEYKCV